MINKVVHLNEFYNLEYDPIIEISVIDIFDVEKRAPSKTIIVVPGGGYDFVSKREGDPICAAFMLQGYVTVKLVYSTDPVNHKIMYPTPQLELLSAVDYIINHANEYSIDVNQITMVGFSAGGHLVGCYAYKYKEIAHLLNLNNNIEQYKPKAICLSYPVITLVNNTHEGTKNNITGGNEELAKELSIELHVDKDYPSTFIWTTKEDLSVDPISTYLMDEALTKANVIHKTIIYPKGGHGLSLATKLTDYSQNEYNDVKEWINECGKFFDFILKK